MDSGTLTFELRTMETNLPVAKRLLNELRRMYANGGAFFERFEVTGIPEFEQLTMIYPHRWEEMDFFRRFLIHPTLRATLPELTEEITFGESIRFERIDSLMLDGELAIHLISAGAYSHFKGTPREAKNFAGEFCDELFGDRFAEVEIFRSWDAWSSWFFQVAWDVTYIVIDRRFRQVSLLCWTDTD